MEIHPKDVCDARSLTAVESVRGDFSPRTWHKKVRGKRIELCDGLVAETEEVQEQSFEASRRGFLSSGKRGIMKRNRGQEMGSNWR